MKSQNPDCVAEYEAIWLKIQKKFLWTISDPFISHDEYQKEAKCCIDTWYNLKVLYHFVYKGQA